MLMFILDISCLTTSNLPWFTDLTFKFLCNIVFYSIRLYSHHQTHPQLSVTSLLASHFILSGAISNCPLFFTSSILEPEWLIFWCHIFLPFHTIHGLFAARVLEWFAIPSFVRALHYDLSVLGDPHGMAYIFVELCKPLCPDKDVVHEIVHMCVCVYM